MTKDELRSEINDLELSETEKINLINCRIGQGDFRKNLKRNVNR